MRVTFPATLLSLAVLWTSLPFAEGARPMAACGPDECGAAEACGPSCDSGACGPSCESEAGECGECFGRPGLFDRLLACDPCGPRWSFAAEAIALQRTNTRPQALVVPLDSQIVDPIDASSLNFPVAFGYHVSAIRHDVLGCCDLEIAYFQLDGFEAQANMAGPTAVIADFNGMAILAGDAEVNYKSALYNAEINVRHNWCDWLTTLVGVRMVELDERYSASGEIQDGEFGAAAVSGLLGVNTFNHLYGVQLGAEAEVYNMGGPLQIRALCKAGVFDNAAFNNYSLTDIAYYGAQRDQAAFLGEAGVVATYCVTQRLAFRASATAMWISGVALAPEQIGTVDLLGETASIDTDGTVFYYGGGLGLEYRF